MRHKRKGVSNPDNGLYFHEELHGFGRPPLPDGAPVELCCEAFGAS